MTEYLDRYPTMHEYAEGKRINPKLTDLISRADAIAYIDRVTNSGLGRNKSLDYIHKYISSLPSADAVQGWIPCSERLPSEDGSYIVTSSFGKVYTAHFYSEYGRWQYNRRGLIEAWMPLPKPYREESEVEE